MLRIYDENKVPVKGIQTYQDLCIKEVLDLSDKTLSFSLPTGEAEELRMEGYIRTKTDEFVIKEKEESGDYTTITAVLNLEDFEGKEWLNFESAEQTPDAALRLAIAGTGWTIGECTQKKRRTIRTTNSSALEILKQVIKTYHVEIRVDSLHKKIDIYDQIGEDRGVYFIDALNLKELRVQSTSYDFYTRIEPRGKDGLTIAEKNDGKTYLENYQYSKKKKTLIWKDERYTVPESLKEDAKVKLDDMAKPYTAYTVSALDLSRASKQYAILEYEIGDVVTLIDRNTNTREKQRIVSMTCYPQEPDRNSCEVSNRKLTFEQLSQKYENAADTVDNITNDNGTVDGDKVDGIYSEQIYDLEDAIVGNMTIQNLTTQYLTVTGELRTVRAKVGEIETNYLRADQAEIKYLKADLAELTYAKIENLEATNAIIGTLQADTASIKKLYAEKFTAIDADIVNLHASVARIDQAYIKDLTAVHASIQSLEAESIRVKNLLAGNITAENIQAGSITAGSGIIANGAIGDAQISFLSANKLRAGTIDTSLVTVSSSDSVITLTGNQIMINDTTNTVEAVNRVTLGKYKATETTWEYGLLVRSADGQTTMIDGAGVHNAGITDGAVNNNKIADDAEISGTKLDINSVVREVNGATERIASTVVQVGDKTLQVVLEEQTNRITEQGKTLATHGTEIQANQDAIQLKVDTQVYQADLAGLNSSLEKSASSIAVLEGQITLKVEKAYVENKVTTVKEYATALVEAIPAEVWTESTTPPQGAKIWLNGTEEDPIELPDMVDLSDAKMEAISASENYANTIKSEIIQTTDQIRLSLSSLTTKVATVEKAVTDGDSELVTKITQVSKQTAGFAVTLEGMTGKVTDYVSSSIHAVTDGIETTMSTLSQKQAKMESTLTGYETSLSSLQETVKKKADNMVVSELSSQYSGIRGDLDGLSLSVTKDYVKKTELGTQISSVNAQIKLLKDQIDLGISETDYERIQNYVSGELTEAEKNLTDAYQEYTDEKVAAIRITTEGITTEVSNLKRTVDSYTTQISGKAETTSVTAIANRAASLETKLTGISGKVTDYVSSSVKTVRDDLTESVSEVSSRQTALELNVNGFRTTVSETYATKTAVTSAEGKVDAIETRMQTAESSIAQNKSAIGLKVSESSITGNYLVGKINLSSTTATIEARNINLNGIVTANNTFKIDNNGTATITGGFVGGMVITPMKLYGKKTDEAGVSWCSGIAPYKKNQYSIWAGETNGYTGFAGTDAAFRVDEYGHVYCTKIQVTDCIDLDDTEINFKAPVMNIWRKDGQIRFRQTFDGTRPVVLCMDGQGEESRILFQDVGTARCDVYLYSGKRTSETIFGLWNKTWDSGVFRYEKSGKFKFVTGVQYSSTLEYVSREKYKMNIADYAAKQCLDIVMQTKVYGYNLKEDFRRGLTKRQIGFIIDRECPDGIVAESGEGINAYSALAAAYGAIQEQQQEIKQLKRTITKMQAGGAA